MMTCLGTFFVFKACRRYALSIAPGAAWGDMMK